MSCIVIGCRHIGAGQFRHGIDQALPVTVGGDVAAVKKNIPRFSQGAAPAGNGVAVGLQAGIVEPGSARRCRG